MIMWVGTACYFMWSLCGRGEGYLAGLLSNTPLPLNTTLGQNILYPLQFNTLGRWGGIRR